MPAVLHGLPGRGLDVDSPLWRALYGADRDDPVVRLALVDQVLREDPTLVEAQRLRQDLLSRRGRRSLLVTESEDRLAQAPTSALTHYLRGRLAQTAAGRREAFERAVDSEPGFFWAWFGLAFAVRASDPQQSIAIYRRLAEHSGEVPLVQMALAAALRSADQTEAALAVYDELTISGRWAGAGWLGRAQTLFAADRQDEAWKPVLHALRLRPADPGVRSLVRAYLDQGLSPRQVRQLLAVLYEEPGRLKAFAQAGAAVLAADLCEELGHNPAALAALSVRPEGERSAAARARRPTLLLRIGEVAGFLAELRAGFSADLLNDERNQVRGLWVAIFGSEAAQAADPLENPSAAIELGRALLRAGLLEQAATLIDLLLLRHPALGDAEVAAALAVQDEARVEAAFEQAVGLVLYRGYESEDPVDLVELLEELRELSRRILRRDVVGEPELFDVPMLGRMVNAFGPGLAQHLATYNKHLVLGQRYGRPAEGLMLTRLSLRYLERDSRLPLSSRCWQVIGDRRQIHLAAGLMGGDLAGIALLNHYVIDMDAVRDWALNLRVRRSIIRADHAALVDDPLPVGVQAGDAVDVDWRLAWQAPVADDELELAVLDMICLHERAHLVDSFHYLPPENNLWRVLGLLFEFGFDAFAIESEMEGRAECAALACSPYTELVLAHIASFCGLGATGSPHAQGFQRLADRINRELATDPTETHHAMVSRWHLVPAEKMRAIARRLR